MDFMVIWNTILGYAPVITAVIAACAAISAVTPSKVDDRFMQWVLDIVNKLGLNVGKAKNLDDAK